jgi:hypothetical protein
VNDEATDEAVTFPPDNFMLQLLRERQNCSNPLATPNRAQCYDMATKQI